MDVIDLGVAPVSSREETGAGAVWRLAMLSVTQSARTQSQSHDTPALTWIYAARLRAFTGWARPEGASSTPLLSWMGREGLPPQQKPAAA